MRKFFMVAIAVSALLALVPARAGQFTGGSYTGTPSTIVTSLFAQFPNGGPELAAAIAQLLVSTPQLSADVAFVASRGSPGQQSAAGTGMGQARTNLQASGNTAGANDITGSVQQSGSTALQAAASLASDNLTPSTFVRRCTTTVSPSTTTCE
jgi:hypothetical protein